MMCVLVEETVAHPVLFQVALTIMMSLLHAVSTHSNIKIKLSHLKEKGIPAQDILQMQLHVLD